MEETISLQELIGVLKKRVGLIIVSMFLGLGIAGVLTYFVITPRYSSQAQLIVRLPQNETTNVNDINGNLQMINTYKDLIKSDTVMSEVQKKMKAEHENDLSVEELGASVSVNQSQNSQMFSIVSKVTDPILAQNIANQTALVFQEKAKDMLNVDKITIISAATANVKPVSPNDKLNLLIGVALGIIFGIAAAFILELFDKTIKDDRFVEDELGFTILGVVPNMTAKELSAKVVRAPSTSQVVEPRLPKSLNLNTEPLKNMSQEKAESDASTPVRRSRPRV
ncbi:YveK family protein [Enterococcus quebecensis]|uniref:Capsular polysaccharide biosynthesis protein CpsC n=1 Tax=Enterococcus quebecensis TaxID=903983 RepID=A0A1E5GPQ0_9ENTE|nr:Wzz/FepE/Etk N-terminal domain-containing protein [Enterococcus quebecensis]OEG14673.1 tyrosine protein kinase [Enterococcus quebecensis]